MGLTLKSMRLTASMQKLQVYGQPQAAEHGDSFDDGRLLENERDKPAAVAYAWKRSRLLPGCDVQANRPIWGPIPQESRSVSLLVNPRT